ncbi:putative sad1 unc domain-containing protein [Rosellinia necatrix]|uniref:Putative sad1 unc domain-containing protein n=1 Tax=Rosellinia necatrix TaxID=77044 RepID=A0A1W2TMR4_ROSNE|nr:putative sad1 unc domain-containing protein [Rosellinia necatrix]
MRPFVEGRLRALALVSLVVLPFAGVASAQADGGASTLRDAARSSPSAPSMEPTCESRTVNYITDSLPQQCLTTGPITSMPISDTASVVTTTSTPTSSDPVAHTSDVVGDDPEPEGEDLSTGAFMSFEEWKAMMVAKSGPDALEAKPRRSRDGRADAPGDGFDSLGDEGEISFDFDAYSDKISEIASSARPREQEKEKKEQVEMVAYEEGFTYYRSKDAGTTCKERFSYSSFDAGATVKKTGPGAKNPTAILVENKDSYMLLECGRKNKFFIVELSDVILVDTVVIANFEFFSSMVRQFRVSISDHYPVKLDKWKVLDTFQARNSRDIQPFLVENPQDWARYLRVEILSHYGNEYYCPVSLLRVHGLRMLDSWKQVDPSELEGEDESLSSIPEPAGENIEVADEPQLETEVIEPVRANNYTMAMEQSCWTPYWDGAYFQHTFPLVRDCTQANDPKFNASVHSKGPRGPAPTGPQSTTTVDNGVHSAMPNTSSAATAARQTADPLADSPRSGSPASAFAERPMSTGASIPPSSSSGSRDNTLITATATSMSQTANENTMMQNISKGKSSASTSIKPPSSRSSAKTSLGSQTTVRNKTSTPTSPPPSAPTVQDSFFKALTKRLQILESNSTLSLQYIESQSRFLQEALAKLERRQIAKVDLFLDKLNNTVLGELREVRILYDHIWQSTVIALESQREQTEHEIVALSTRVGVLADEVVFQKRMAIVQSVLLLGCLVLVIFSRGFAGSAVEAYYPSQFLPSSRLASPILPSTPRAQLKGARSGLRLSGDQSPTNTTPVRTRAASRSTQARPRINDDRNLGRTSEQGSTGPKGANSTLGIRSATQIRTLSDPSGLDFQPPTPSSMDDMAYDSEPAMTPNGDYFSATTSVNGDPAAGGGEEEEEASRMYPEMLARQSERQLTPTSDAEASEYILPRSGRPGIAHSGSTRKPLPALPEDPD